MMGISIESWWQLGDGGEESDEDGQREREREEEKNVRRSKRQRHQKMMVNVHWATFCVTYLPE